MARDGEQHTRAVARKLRPDWSDEQFEAHWEEFLRIRNTVARGRRKQMEKRSHKEQHGKA